MLMIKLTLNTSIYASYGKGGGSGPLGSTSRYYGNTDRTSDGLIDWDVIESRNGSNSSNSPRYGLSGTVGSETTS